MNSRGSHPTSWCPTCEEDCMDHPSMCTICGETLIAKPVASTEPVMGSSVGSGRGNNYDNLVSALRAASAGGDNAIQEDMMWEIPSAEAMDPQQASVASSSRSTSETFLKSMINDQIVVDEYSAILHQAIIELTIPSILSEKGQQRQHEKSYSKTLYATISEFEPYPPYDINGPLVLCQPNIHGKLPISPSPYPPQSILFMERGGSITFAQKSNNASSANASAVICANTQPVWPYTMKDSTGKGGSVPVVMIKQSDGQMLKSLLRKCNQQQQQQQLLGEEKNIKESTQPCINARVSAVKDEQKNCVICTEVYCKGDTIIRIPFCGHVFHLKCALSWLKMRNTCPYCRRELPSDDAEYEMERRNRIGGANRNRASEGTDHDNNGSGSAQFEGFFG